MTVVRPRAAAPAAARARPARSAPKTLRQILFWCHLTVGVAVGIVVLIMSATGVALAYERQVLEWAAGRHRVGAPAHVAPDARWLPLDTLLARAQAAAGGRHIAALTIRADSSMPVAAALQDRRALFVDQYRGRVIGSDSSARAFFTGVQRWHRWLALGGSSRSAVGRAITGVANLAFLFLILSGFVLWWPRQWSARAFRAVLVFTPRARGKARDWNWHHVLGFWSAPALLLIVLTGAFISYAWPQRLVERWLVAPGQAEARGRAEPEGPGGRPRGAEYDWLDRPHASLEGVWRLAAREMPGWTSVQMRFPPAPGRPVTVTVATGAGARPDQRLQLTVDGTTGELVERQALADAAPARQLRAWVRPVHTGEAGGLPGQTIAAAVSAAGMVLVWTGLALAWRRLRTTRDS